MSTFDNLVEQSPTLQAKWSAVCQAIQKNIADTYGIEVDEETVKTLEQARYLTLSNDKLDEVEFKKQVEGLKQLREVIKIREIAAGNSEVRRSALAEVNAMPSGGKSDRERKDNLAAKMSAARKFGITSTGGDYEETLSSDQKIQHCLTIPNVQERMNQARRYGILK